MDAQAQQGIHVIVFVGDAVEMATHPFHLFPLGNCEISKMGRLFRVGNGSGHFKTAGSENLMTVATPKKGRKHNQAGFTTTPERMHLVQALTRLTEPSYCTCRTCWRLGYQMRLVLLLAWLTLLPT